MTSGGSMTPSGSMSNDNAGTSGSATDGNRVKGRVTIVAVMIIALVAAGFTRHVAEAQRGAPAAGTTQTGTNLSNMNSFALALLLGGLRGPLVMILWTSSEAQKTEKNLEDFDTKVEWIRMLQPEFDTVHIFQIWNKAYNISVQMASNANKYITILDAIEYAKSVNRERPNNINIIYQIGSVYFDKLGGASEKAYYRKRVREETLPHRTDTKLNRGEPGWRPLKMDPMLDERGMILPQYKDELVHLVQFQPFPYGLSPQALGYNYFKRAQELQEAGQRHAQISDLVIDSRPGLALRMWAEEEIERGRNVELAAFGNEVPTDPDQRFEKELPTADVSLTAAPARAAVQEALYSYNQAARLLEAAQREYERHLLKHSINRNTYEFHIEHIKNLQHLARGDHDFLAAQLATGPERDRLAASAADHYRKALRQAEYILVRYHIDDRFVPELFPPGTSRLTADKIPPEMYRQILLGNRQILRQTNEFDQFAEDRVEYERYADRAAMRLAQLEKAGH
ncbi:MAG TPA: hypothetical protein VGR35_20845 [Tepidisphaeraceae bacterium]|nr:hypothetical protein [Tepidisphaeraceae bacterium]